MNAGDIDNRIKTVIDCLRYPLKPNEVVVGDAPKDGEDPFFVLLEDDKQVTGLTLETDTLLDPPSGNDIDQRKVKLMITVEIRPYDVSIFNLSFPRGSGTYEPAE